MSEWSGRRVMEARAFVAANWLPAPCARCGVTVDGSNEWVVGHKVARSLDPSLTWVVSNWQVECKPCSDSSGTLDKAALRFFPRRDVLEDLRCSGLSLLVLVAPA